MNQTAPTRDEAVRKDPPRIWLEPVDWSQPFAGDERTWCEDKVWPEGDDQGEPTEYIRADLASAPAPASGGVEAVARAIFDRRHPFENWAAFDERFKARGNKLHPMQEEAIEDAKTAIATLASLSPAATPVSEAPAFETCSDCGGAGESPDGCLCRGCGGGGRTLAKPASSPAGDEGGC